jgi:putative copper export protein
MTPLITRLGQRFWALLLVITLALAGISLVGHAGMPKPATLPQPITTAAAIRASGA